jgi:hypothetical protein
LVVPQENYVSFSVHGLCDTLTFCELNPLHVVVAESVARRVLENSGQEVMLKIFLERAEFELMKGKSLTPVK